MVREEAPGVVVVLVREQHSDAAAVCTISNVEALGAPVSPDHAEEEGAGRCHDGDVRKNPVAVVARQRVDHAHEKRVTRNGAHCVVGDSCRSGPAHPRWVREKRVEAAIAAIVQVDVDSAIVCKYEIADCVGALNGEFVIVKGFEKPWVLVLDELARFGVGPHDVFPIFLVQLQTTSLGLLPDGGNALVDVCLVYDFGDHLRSAFDEVGAWSGQFGA